MPHLFSPLVVRGVTIPNRMTSASLCLQESQDGFIEDHHCAHYASQAASGAGLVMTEIAAVEKDGRQSNADIGIWKDEHLEGMRKMVRLIQQQGSVAGLRIGHSGFNTKEENLTIAPSCKQLQSPSQFEESQLEQVIHSYQLAARRACNSGFQVLEIQANRGDLLHQMLSGLLNHRTDTYGGNFKNRTRFLLEVVAATRNEWPENLPLFVRLAATDYSDCPDSWQLMDALRVSRTLQQSGVDLIIPSAGGLEGEAIRKTSDRNQVSLSWAIRNQGNIPTGALGVPSEQHQANRIVKHEMADLVVLNTPLLKAS